MNKLRRGMMIVLAALLILAAVSSPASAAGLGVCEKALIACLMTPGNNTPWAIVFCLEGYSFCKSYIQPLLH